MSSGTRQPPTCRQPARIPGRTGHSWPGRPFPLLSGLWMLLSSRSHPLPCAVKPGGSHQRPAPHPGLGINTFSSVSTFIYLAWDSGRAVRCRVWDGDARSPSALSKCQPCSMNLSCRTPRCCRHPTVPVSQFNAPSSHNTLQHQLHLL